MASDRRGKARIKGKCPYCAAAVKEENLPRHLRSVHPSRAEALNLAKELEASARKSRPKARGKPYRSGLLASKTFLVLLVAVLVVAAGTAAYLYLPRGPAGQDPELTMPIGQICYQLEQSIIHRHVLLHILFNNVAQPIPAGIGIPRTAGGLDSCWRPLHTHLQDIPGRIHYESRVSRTYTLGDFFTLWALNEPGRTIRFDSSHILDRTGGSIRVEVNFAPVQTFETTALLDLNSSPSTDPQHIYIYYTGP